MSWLTRLRTRLQASAAEPVVFEPGEAGYATSQEQRRSVRQAVAAASAEDMQQRHEAELAGDGDRNGARRRDVRGRPYPLWAERVRQLKREERLDEALDLLFECIGAAERDRGRGAPAPWYTEHAAMIFRQRRDYDAEVAVLERWVRVSPVPLQGGKIVERLAKARALQSKHAG